MRSDVTPSDKAGQALQAAVAGVDMWNPDWLAVLKDLEADTDKWHDASG